MLYLTQNYTVDILFSYYYNKKLKQQQEEFDQKINALLQQQQQRPSTRLAKQNAFIIPKFGWPTYFKLGKNSFLIEKVVFIK